MGINDDLVCPNCSNALTVSRAEPSSQYPLGINRFECRTCPYQYVLDRAYFEDTPMKQKEVEEVFGGKEEFKNADSMAGKSSFLSGTSGVPETDFLCASSMSCRRLPWRPRVLLPASDSQCGRADDHILKGTNGVLMCSLLGILLYADHDNLVHHLRYPLERELKFDFYEKSNPFFFPKQFLFFFSHITGEG